jgi:hypothetical protein
LFDAYFPYLSLFIPERQSPKKPFEDKKLNYLASFESRVQPWRKKVAEFQPDEKSFSNILQNLILETWPTARSRSAAGTK